MNLEKLFEMQRKLDERIAREKDLERQNLLDKKILALQVELGELCNCWRGFKYWSKDQEPRFGGYCGCDDGYVDIYLGHGEVGQKLCPQCEGEGTLPNRVLEEYVDCLHFLLSIGLDIGYLPAQPKPVKRDTTLDQFHELFYLCADMYYWRNDEGVRGKYLDTFEHLLGLGEMLGFTWEQIEESYFEKNRINHERQESGY